MSVTTERLPMHLRTSHSKSNPYQYQPLQNTRSVRCLKVNPSPSGIFTYELVEYDLDVYDPALWFSKDSDFGSYIAVSYHWGSNTRSGRLVLQDGSFIPTTSSLENAIPLIAHAVIRIFVATNLPYRLIWIDQVCINQEDTRERESQIGLMYELYTKANKVVIWLGGVDDNAMLISAIENSTALLQRNIVPKTKQTLALVEYLGMDNHSREVNNTGEQMFLKFFDRLWFNRAWTFQEAVLPKDLIILTGMLTIDFETLLDVIDLIGEERMGRMLCRARQMDKNAANGYEALMAIRTTRNNFSRETSGLQYLHFLSELAPFYEATNPRDLCYAFLGFQTNPNVSIKPNYSLPVEDVFIDTSKAIVEGMRSLDLFSALHRGPTRVLSSNIPSWVPDWSAIPLVLPIYDFSLARQYPGQARSACAGFRHRASSTRMVVRGKVVDIVHFIHARNSFNDSRNHDARLEDVNIGEMFNLNEIQKRLQSSWHHETPEATSAERILRAILADGANPGDHERILHREAVNGLPDWRWTELVKAYHGWQLYYTTGFWADIQDEQERILPYDHEAKEEARRRYLDVVYELKLGAEALRAYSRVFRNRALFSTRQMVLGISANTVQTGDLVCILHGSQTPVVLRAHHDKTYSVIGQAFVEHMMHGEAVDWKREEEADSFELV
jgi:hypothetical protein